jgi:hypothetical protein
VDDAIQRLAGAKSAQDAVLDEAARTPEAPGTSLDLTAADPARFSQRESLAGSLSLRE